MPTHRDPAPDINARIDSLFARWNRPDSPGAAVSVIQHGREIHRGLYGMADLANDVKIDERSVIRIGSQTKQFTVLLALLLEAEGKLSMEDDVRLYLPWLPEYPRTVTLRHLAANVGGLRDFIEIMVLGGRSLGAPSTRAEVRRLISRHRGTNFLAGDDVLYCNTGFFLLSEIVEEVSGQGFNELLQQRITGPLGMQQTRLMPLDSEILPRLADHHTRGGDGRWHKAQWGLALGGEGGMVSTLEDMKIWLANLDSPIVGTKEMVARMSMPSAAINGINTTYGLGLVTSTYRGMRGIGHGGGVAGGVSESVRFPEAGIGIVILCNSDDMKPFSLARRILDLMQGEQIGPPRTAAAMAQLENAAGLYRAESGDDIFGISGKDGEPLFFGSGNSMKIEQAEDGAFMPERGIYPLKFLPRDDGDMDTNWFGRAQVYRRLPEFALKSPDDLIGRYVDQASDFIAEIVNDNDELVLRLRSSDGLWETRLEARGTDFYLAMPRYTTVEDARQGTWLFTIRSVANGIILNKDRTKNLHLTRDITATS